MAGTVIITGAAGGLGLALAEKTINHPEPLTKIFTIRDCSAANAQPLVSLVETHEDAEIEELDLSDLDAVRKFALDINQRVASEQLPPIRALILNAAIIPFSNQRLYVSAESEEKKMEMMFAVNHLANFLLTLLLLESMDREQGRIVLVSSHAHDPKSPTMRKHSAEKLGWDLEEISRGRTLPDPGDEANDTMRRYGMSKFCQILFMHALQKRLSSTNGFHQICVLAINPGAMAHSNIFNKMNPFMRNVVGPITLGVFKFLNYLNPNGLIRTVERSAADVDRAAFGIVDPELGKYPKGVYLDGAKRVEPAADSFDEDKQKELWDFGMKLVQLEERDTALGDL